MNFLKNGIKIINKDILMEYFRKLKKEGKQFFEDDCKDYLGNVYFQFKLEDLTVFEYEVLKKVSSKTVLFDLVTFRKDEKGELVCLDKTEPVTEYKNKVKVLDNLLRTIDEETGIKFQWHCIPIGVIELSAEFYIDITSILSFFGTNFWDALDKYDKTGDDLNTLLAELLFRNVYLSLRKKAIIKSSNRQSTTAGFMKKTYDLISDTETIKLKSVSTYYSKFDFINSKDDIKELKRMVNNDNGDVKVEFLLNTDLGTFFKLFDYVCSHEAYDRVILNWKFNQTLPTELDEYLVRFEEAMNPIHQELIYLVNDADPHDSVNSWMYMTLNQKIKFIVSDSLENLLSGKGLYNRIKEDHGCGGKIESDVNIIQTLNQTKEVLSKLIDVKVNG